MISANPPTSGSTRGSPFLGVLPPERHPRGARIDGRPLERRHLALAPARAVREPGAVLQLHRQPRDDDIELRPLDESLTAVILRQELHPRDRGRRPAVLPDR